MLVLYPYIIRIKVPLFRPVLLKNRTLKLLNNFFEKSTGHKRTFMRSFGIQKTRGSRGVYNLNYKLLIFYFNKSRAWVNRPIAKSIFVVSKDDVAGVDSFS